MVGYSTYLFVVDKHYDSFERVHPLYRGCSPSWFLSLLCLHPKRIYVVYILCTKSVVFLQYVNVVVA